MTIPGAVRSVVLLLVLLGGAGTVRAQEAGQLVGRVTDGVGRAVEGARVEVVRDEPAAQGRTARSGETGGFGFGALPPGRYRVRVERAGFQPREERVTVEPGDRHTLIVRLRPAERRRGR